MTRSVATHPAPADSAWKPWAWRQIGLDLPGDWEMLQYSKNPAKGGSSFADRTGFRFQLVWSQVPGPPDTGRMLRDYRSRLECSEGLEQAKEERHRHWIAVSGIQEGRPVTRFGNYLEPLGRMLELVFLHRRERDEDLEQRVIQSCQALPERNDRIPWKACGLSFEVRSELPLDTILIAPARASFLFKDPKRFDQEKFERLGMVTQWLNGSLDSWMDAQKPVTLRDWQIQTRQHAGCRVRTGIGTLPATRTFGKQRTFQMAAWIHSGDGRLYIWRSIRRSGTLSPIETIPLLPQ